MAQPQLFDVPETAADGLVIIDPLRLTAVDFDTHDSVVRVIARGQLLGDVWHFRLYTGRPGRTLAAKHAKQHTIALVEVHPLTVSIASQAIGPIVQHRDYAVNSVLKWLQEQAPGFSLRFKGWALNELCDSADRAYAIAALSAPRGPKRVKSSA